MNKQTKCTERGCRNLQWKCADCGRIASSAIFPSHFMEWISVKDRLPENCTWCIAFGKREFEIEWDGTENEEPESVWNAYFDYSFRALCLSNELNGEKLKATHWMPLPKPPEAK